MLISMIADERLELVGNHRLADEYRRLGEELDSSTCRLILGQLVGKMKVIEVDERALVRCRL